MRTHYLKISSIGLVALAAGIVAVHYEREAQRERYYSRARFEISELQTSLERFQVDNGRFPNTDEGLGTLFGQAEMDSGFVRGLARPQSPLDPWGHHYFYESDGENYVLGSFGPRKGHDPDPSLLVVHSE
jgi:general secretion pathway protein G